MRKEPLVSGSYYHIFNRSIAQFRIFEKADFCERFVQMLDLYRFPDFNYKYSVFLNLSMTNQEAVIERLKNSTQKYISIIAYCVMPTHFHLILRQDAADGITKYMAKVLNSYSRYFNLSHQRKGPLWEGHFENVLVKSDEQMLHLTRYIHLNPMSTGLINKPEEWKFSSYAQYLNTGKEGFCNFEAIIDIVPEQYQKFVNDNIAYQKELSIIKSVLIDNYLG